MSKEVYNICSSNEGSQTRKETQLEEVENSDDTYHGNESLSKL